MAHPVRRNFAHLTPAERQAYINAVLQADLHAFPGGVSYWDKPGGWATPGSSC